MVHQVIAIEYAGIIHTFINEDKSMDYQLFYDKCWFKVRNAERFEDPNLLEQFAEIWVTKKMTGAEYDEHIEGMLRDANPIYVSGR
jgi:hypothetical protein